MIMVMTMIVVMLTSPIVIISSLLAPESSHSWLFDLLRLSSCLRRREKRLGER